MHMEYKQHKCHKCLENIQNNAIRFDLWVGKNFPIASPEPSPAGYVLVSLGSSQRWALASLQSGCLPLAVETGRHRIPKVPLGAASV